MKLTRLLCVLVCLVVPSFAEENVTTYGAVASFATDSTTPFQNAMNAACGTDKKVYVPNSGTFYVKTATLVPTCVLKIRGDAGYEYTDVPGMVPVVTTSNVAFISGTAFQSSYDLTIEHLNITGPANGTGTGFDIRGAGANYSFKNATISAFLYSINATSGNALKSLKLDMVQLYPWGTNSVGVNVQNIDYLSINRSGVIGPSIVNGVAKNAFSIRDVRSVDLTRNSATGINAGPVVAYATAGASGCPINAVPYKVAMTRNTFGYSLDTLAASISCGDTVSSLTVAHNYISNMTDSYVSNYATMLVQTFCGSHIQDFYTDNNAFDHLAMSAIAVTSSSAGGCAGGTAPGIVDVFESKNDTVDQFSTAYPGVLPAINSNNGAITPPVGTPTSYLVRAVVEHLVLTGGTSVLNLGSFWAVSVF